MKPTKLALLTILASAAAAHAQVNVGTQASETNLPFTMTEVATFKLP